MEEEKKALEEQVGEDSIVQTNALEDLSKANERIFSFQAHVLFTIVLNRGC